MDGWTLLGRRLREAGVMGSGWGDAFDAVPRHPFLPDVMWPHDMATGRTVTVSRDEWPELWRSYADSDVPIVTQWDDGSHTGPGPGVLATSSASMPSVVLRMLRDLDVRPGHRVLDIGTGTGWNAALLAHRVGAEQVVTVEVDGVLAERARLALGRTGFPVSVVHGDGLLGHPPAAPYDRVIVTCGLRALPYAWVRQIRPGGVVVVPWGTEYGQQDAVARLVVAPDGRSASGHLTGPVEFMKLRSQRGPDPDHSSYVGGSVRDSADSISATELTASRYLGETPFAVQRFVLGLRLRGCRHVVAERRDGARPVWLYGLTDRSWACALFRDGHADAPVWQGGPRRLWDEAEAAYAWWRDQGSPGYERFGLTVTPDGTRAWLDEPERSWDV
ncbi:methyltransferase domain-containing protein [Streptomyces sp. SID4919]|uniref:methyltransferase domain-containing protein n=1 Tax=Streptomyces sp. AmelKG-E11A TaxID=1100822 RepID=UPI000C07C195|nr:methyltransferase domain-containing protein [Streptomyces sp. SID4919]